LVACVIAPEPSRLTAASLAVTCAVGVPKNAKKVSPNSPVLVSPILLAAPITSSSQGAR
jgi:hypothetical protein